MVASGSPPASIQAVCEYWWIDNLGLRAQDGQARRSSGRQRKAGRKVKDG